MTDKTRTKTRTRDRTERLAQWLYAHTLGCLPKAEPTGAPTWESRAGEEIQDHYRALARKLEKELAR